MTTRSHPSQHTRTYLHGEEITLPIPVATVKQTKTKNQQIPKPKHGMGHHHTHPHKEQKTGSLSDLPLNKGGRSP